MNEIHIRFMSDEMLEFIRTNQNLVSQQMRENPTDSSWLSAVMSRDKNQIFIEKRFVIPDFQLRLSSSNHYDEVDMSNATTLFESLHKLPRYILTDERFWAWINFDKCYSAALQAMPIGSSNSTLNDHYLFGAGNRRGLFFGVMSRCYFRVELSYDPGAENPYELSSYVIEDPERVRNLTWRAYSNQKHIVIGALRAQKEIQDTMSVPLPKKVYGEIAKYISRLGSVMLLDAISQEDIFNYSKLFIQDYMAQKESI